MTNKFQAGLHEKGDIAWETRVRKIKKKEKRNRSTRKRKRMPSGNKK
jgi:hypothetical protein